MKYRLTTILLLVSLFLPACHKNEVPKDTRLKIGVTLAPQAWLAEKIGGDQAVVSTLIAPGVSPETFDPTPKDMASIFSAELFFVAGFDFEHHIIEKMAAKNQKVLIDPSETMPLRHFGMAESHHHHHHHHDNLADANSEHHNCPHYAEHHGPKANIDPHFWFSIKHVRHHAAVMAQAMVQARPEQAAYFKSNLEKLYSILDQLEKEGREVLTPHKGRSFLVFHPTYGYLAEEFGLNQVAIEVEGKEPTPKQLAEITAQAKENHITTIIVQPQFPFSAASAVAEAIGGQVVIVDSLSNEYEAMYRHLVETLAVSFKDTVSNEQ